MVDQSHIEEDLRISAETANEENLFANHSLPISVTGLTVTVVALKSAGLVIRRSPDLISEAMLIIETYPAPLILSMGFSR